MLDLVCGAFAGIRLFPMQIVTCVLLLVVANGAPVVANDIFGARWNHAVDGGHRFADGRPWFGASKTWRGILAAIIAAGIAGALLEVGWHIGMAVGGLAMLGDLSASFLKRRLAVPVSGRSWLLDQLPEAVLPLFLLHGTLGLTLPEAAVAVLAFTLLDLLISPLLYRLRLRKRPY